jgi:hypothetical protein
MDPKAQGFDAFLSLYGKVVYLPIIPLGFQIDAKS